MYNKHTILGNVGSVDENRFSVAVNKNYRDKKGEWQTKTSWFTIFLGGKQKEYVVDTLALTKGDQVIVDAEISSGKKDGTTVYYWNLIALKRIAKAGGPGGDGSEEPLKRNKPEKEITPWDEEGEDW